MIINCLSKIWFKEHLYTSITIKNNGFDRQLVKYIGFSNAMWGPLVVSWFISLTIVKTLQ